MSYHLPRILPRADFMADGACSPPHSPFVLEVARAAGFASVLDMFFISPGQAAEPAKLVCADCPVRIECLEYALTDPSLHGIWAGLGQRERMAERRRRRTADGRPQSRPRPINHGTPGGYIAHRRRGEEPCDDCRRARKLKQVEQRQAKREAARRREVG